MADPYRLQAEAAFFVPNFVGSHKPNPKIGRPKWTLSFPAFIPGIHKIFSFRLTPRG